MKMAKKLLAVVLAGVMAVSMLTGCALSDKVKAEALEKALNSTQVKAATQNPDEAKNVTFSYKSDLNSVAGKAWGDENGMKSGKATSFATTYVGKLAEYTNGGKKYFTYVVDVTDVKTGKSGEWTTRAVDLRDAVANKGFGTTKETIKDYNADNTKKTGKFGFDIKSVTNDVSGSKKTTNYAIIVFEAGANA
ncbi:MAG: hypothetical protein ACLSEF_07470 [Faecalibacterium prausnitzii]|uniref:hypothetical protein n=1 Tax=Faecalibacterium prausnitzii TaxID=853 RepID=UPI002FBC2FFE